MWNVYHRPIRFGLIYLVLISLLANACRLFSSEPVAEINATLTALGMPQASATPADALATATQIPSPDSTPKATASPASPSPEVSEPSLTPEPSLPQPARLRAELSSLINTPEWQSLGLQIERAKTWQEFAEDSTELSPAELDILQDFLARYSILNDLMAKPLPDNTRPGLRVVEITDKDGTSQPVLYVIDELNSKGNEAPQLFLIAHDAEGEAQALLLAPDIPELRQRPSPDGAFVEYFDDKGNWILRADARQLDAQVALEKELIDMLKENDVDRLYDQAKIYPRFIFNLPDVPSRFYMVEKLTINQIKLLIATIQEFDRQPFQGLKEFTFRSGDNVPILITRQDHPFAAALALPMGGKPPQGIILLFSRNLFANKYETMASIAHEVVHIWQGVPPGCDKPQARLQREIGNGTIPDDFRKWSAAEIIKQSTQTHELGAYHMSLWVAMHYNLENYIRFYRSIITTGTANGQSIINCGPP